MLVKDVMNRAVVTLRADATLHEAIACLDGMAIGGAPVTRGDRVVGVISKTDLIKPGTATAERVSDVMTPYVLHVNPTDTAEDALRRMLAERVHRLVVVDDDGNLAGLVTTVDLLRGLGRSPSEAHREEHAPPSHAVPWYGER
jgi:predicted transcriptional regulator